MEVTGSSATFQNWKKQRGARVNQPPSTHHVGWMVCGQETLFHLIPPQLTTVVTNVLTTNHPHVTHLPNYIVTTYICYLLT